MNDRRRQGRRLFGAYLLIAVVVLVVVGLAAPEASRLATLAWTATALVGGAGVFGYVIVSMLSDLAPTTQNSGRSETARLDTDRTRLELALGAIDIPVAIIGDDDAVRYLNLAFQAIVHSNPQTIHAITPPAVGRLVTECRTSTQRTVETVTTGRPPRSLRIIATPLAEGEVIVTVMDVSSMSRLTAMRRDFIADASHELKTPIASIRSSAETLQRALERNDKEASLRFTHYIVENAERLGRIVADLLDLSRIESSDVALTRLDISDVASRELEPLDAAATEKGIDLRLEMHPAHVQGNESDLAIVVRNLVENAIRNTSVGGTVTVSVDTDHEIAMVKVSDTGRGIASRDLPRIFERFYRVEDDRNRGTGGTGLGLAIVKHIVENHGGVITVDSTLGTGSCFTVEIPTNPDEVRSDDGTA